MSSCRAACHEKCERWLASGPRLPDPAVEPGETLGVLAGLVVDVGAGVHGVAGRRLDREGVRRQLLRLAPALLVLADERQLAGVPPVVAVGAAQTLDQLGGLAAGREAAERHGRDGDADGQRVTREQPDVAQQGGGAGLLVAAQPGGHGVEEADLAVVEVAVRRCGVRGLEGLTPRADGAPLVAEQGQRRVGLGEAGVGGHRRLEARTRRRPAGRAAGRAPGCRPGRLAVGGQGEAVGVHRPTAGLAVQRASTPSGPRRRPARGSPASPWSPTGCRGAACRSRRTGWSGAAHRARGRRRRCRCPGPTGRGGRGRSGSARPAAGPWPSAPAGPVQLTTAATVSSVPSLRVTATPSSVGVAVDDRAGVADPAAGRRRWPRDGRR